MASARTYGEMADVAAGASVGMGAAWAVCASVYVVPLVESQLFRRFRSRVTIDWHRLVISAEIEIRVTLRHCAARACLCVCLTDKKEAKNVTHKVSGWNESGTEQVVRSISMLTCEYEGWNVR
jgi:hypothetical protein